MLASQRNATAMTDATPLPFDLPAIQRKKLTVAFDGGNQSSDAGLLLLRAAEQRTSIIARLARALPDRRDPARVHHQLREMIAQRVYGICCGYEDGIDHDTLRDDPALKMATGRCPDSGAPLASQSTLSRFENAPSRWDAGHLAQALADQFTAHVAPSHRDIFDIVMLKACSPPARPSTRCTAASRWPSGMRITTSAASRPCTSTMRAAGCLWPRSCGQPKAGRSGSTNRHQASDAAYPQDMGQRLAIRRAAAQRVAGKSRQHCLARRQPLWPARSDGLVR